MAKKRALIVFVLLLSMALIFLAIAAENSGTPRKSGYPKNPTPPAANSDSSSSKSESVASKGKSSSEQAQEEDQLGLGESPLPGLYKACETVFGQYVNDSGDVNYSMLRRRRSDLYNAVKILEMVHPAQVMAMNNEEKQAFWINAYNLCTLKLIIDNYPIEPKWYMMLYPNSSIMQIPSPWTKNYFKIQGLEYNLHEIERELLLERFKDPRICFALTYASRGGAILRKEPYRAETLYKQLDDQVLKYLAGPRGLQWDKNSGILSISNLFNVYREIFLKSKYAEIKKFRNRKEDEKAWLNFLTDYLPAEQKSLLETTDYTFKFIAYDWNLNEFAMP
jgi:hypothetical protein